MRLRNVTTGTPTITPPQNTTADSNPIRSKVLNGASAVLKGVAANIFCDISALSIEQTLAKAQIHLFQPRMVPSVLKSGVDWFKDKISSAKLGFSARQGVLGTAWSAFIEEVGCRLLFQSIFVRSLQKLYYHKFYPLNPENIDSRYAQATRIILSSILFGLTHVQQVCYDFPEFVKGDQLGTELTYGTYSWCVCDMEQLKWNSRFIAVTITGIGYAIAMECVQKTKIAAVLLPSICHTASNLVAIHVYDHYLDYFKNGFKYTCHSVLN